MRWYQIFVLIYLALFIVSAVLIIAVKHRRSRITPDRLKKSSSKDLRLLQQYTKTIILVWFLIILGFTFNPVLMHKLKMPIFSESQELKDIGLSAAFIFLIGFIAAQWQTGHSLHAEIDEKKRPKLVAHGFYRYMRHPASAFLLGSFASFIIVYPGNATVVLWGITFFNSYLQAVAEEKFFFKQYGKRYERYKAQTGRFWPKFPGYKAS